MNQLNTISWARKPSELISTGPMDQNWKIWKQQFLIFLKASGEAKKSTDVKACLLINLMGPVGIKTLQKISFDSPEDREDFDILLMKFDNYFLPKETETNKRFIFFSSVRQTSESIKQYVNTLKKRAAACKFGDLTESLIIDKIILDVKNKTLRKSLLRESDLSLNLAIEMWEMCEETEKLTNLLLPKLMSEPDGKLGTNISKKNDEVACGKCGTNHNPKKCPARGQTCDNCGMLNHLGKVCTKPSIHKSVSEIDEASDEDVSESLKEVRKFFNPGPITKAPRCSKKQTYD